jgi:hypothetical protein
MFPLRMTITPAPQPSNVSRPPGYSRLEEELDVKELLEESGHGQVQVSGLHTVLRPQLSPDNGCSVFRCASIASHALML